MLKTRLKNLERRYAMHEGKNDAAPVPDVLHLFRQTWGAPDPWQEAALRAPAMRQLWLCCRQSGKSTTAATLALHTALATPGAVVLLVSPSLRQSQELYYKIRQTYRTLAADPAHKPEAESALRMELANRSRILSLPGGEKTIRGYSRPALIVCDEASRLLDETYHALRPMAALGDCRMVCLTTPWGRRGWFFSAWETGEGWQRTKITAYDCPRIPAAFLADEQRSLPPLWFRSEYLCEFVETEDAVFSYDEVMAALSPDVAPLYPEEPVCPGSRPRISLGSI